jgi:hypothetical protein
MMALYPQAQAQQWCGPASPSNVIHPPLSLSSSGVVLISLLITAAAASMHFFSPVANSPSSPVRVAPAARVTILSVLGQL